ncbi:MAG: cbb3-type cytochrome oxidase maturation protein [Saprospiraceae bacterium]|jgi:cbb3-type cytochrome oxidase maturation protein
MYIILYIIIVSLLVAGGFLLAFFWAVNDGQYEDDFTPAMRILIDDDMLAPVEKDQKTNNSVSKNKSNQNV